MRGSVRTVGLALALLGMGQSAALQAQEGCAELRAQYQQLDTLSASPMHISELRDVASSISIVRMDIVMLNAIPWPRMTEAQRIDFQVAMDVIYGLGSRLGVSCDSNMTPVECADSFQNIAAHAVRMADPAGFQAWRLEEALMKVNAAYDERAVKIIADDVGVGCPATGPCKTYLTNTLKAMQEEAGAMGMINSLTDDTADADSRRPFFQLLKDQLLERMGELRCGEGPEVAPVTVARVAPRDYAPPPPAPVARQVPVGGPVLEMDPARDPQPTPQDAVWTTVKPGLMEYRGNGQYGSWTWDELPQSIGPEGTLVTLTITASTTRTGGWATGIQIRGTNVRITRPDGSPIDLDLPLNLPPESSGQQSMTVLVTPTDGQRGQNAEILVGAFYGAQVRYYYRLVRPAGS